jgi:hypothetical protein
MTDNVVRFQRPAQPYSEIYADVVFPVPVKQMPIANMFDADGGWRVTEKNDQYLDVTLRETGVHYNVMVFRTGNRRGKWRWCVARASDGKVWEPEIAFATAKEAFHSAWRVALLPEACVIIEERLAPLFERHG